MSYADNGGITTNSVAILVDESVPFNPDGGYIGQGLHEGPDGKWNSIYFNAHPRRKSLKQVRDAIKVLRGLKDWRRESNPHSL